MTLLYAWIQRRFVQIATATIVSVLFILTISSTTGRLPATDSPDDRLNDRVKSPNSRNTDPAVQAFSFRTAPTSITAGSSTATATGEQYWSHGLPYTITLNFGGAAGAGTADTFVKSLTDAAAYFTLSKSSIKTRWNLIKAVNNGTASDAGSIGATSVSMVFLAQCPYGTNHVSHNADPAGTGKIIVISMALSADGTTISYSNHGPITYGPSSAPTVAEQ